MIDLASWTDEDLYAGLAVIADLRKAVAPIAVAQAAWALWNEALHPRDSSGKFAVSGTEEGRNIIDQILTGKHDGMTQRSHATHLHIYHALNHAGFNQYAGSYWGAVQNAKKQKQLIHPREAFGKANMHLHTGDLTHLSVQPKTPGVSKPNTPKFQIEQKFLVESTAGTNIRSLGGAYITQKLTGGDRNIIRKYTGTWYGNVNSELREGVLSASERKDVERLDHALAETQTTENMIVGRNIGSTAIEKIRKAGVGGILQDPGFVSTSIQKGGQGFYGSEHPSGVQIEIPKGSPGLYVDSISQHQGEDEFLLPRESEFEIIAVGQSSDVPGKYRLRYIGSNKAVHRPDVQASLTEVKTEIKPVGPYDPNTPEAKAMWAGHPQYDPAKGMAQTPDPFAAQSPTSHVYSTLVDLIGPGAQKVDGPHGSQPGQWWQMAGGTKVYVKPMSLERATNEAGANMAYRLMSTGDAVQEVPSVWIVKDGDQYAIVSREIDGIMTLSPEKWGSPTSVIATAAKVQAAKLWAVDAILSHWDVVGLAHDNLVINSGGGATRIDTGGAMKFRAQGAVKESWKVGGKWNEPWTMRGLTNPNDVAGSKPGQQAKSVFGGLTNAQAADSLLQLKTYMETADPGLINLKKAFTTHGMSASDIADNLAVIQDRLERIPSVVTQLMKNPTLSAASPA